MAISVLSPCHQCTWCLLSIACSPRKRVRCSRYLDYIGQLHNNRLHNILIGELKELIPC